MAPRFHIVLLSLALAATLVVPAVSAATMDPVAVTAVRSGHGKIVVSVQAGATGAPSGFTLWWMTRADYEASGGAWVSGPVPGKGWAAFTGTPTLNTAGGSLASFQLAPFQALDVEIGDLFDETGVASNAPDELVEGEQYVVCGFTNGDGSDTRSALTPTLTTSTSLSTNCTYTQGFWKTHPEAWPVGGLTLGTIPYSAAQLLAILNQPAVGNGLIALAHQLIAAKLNVANGADPTASASFISAADALIGGLVVPPVGVDALPPSTTSALTQSLDDWNNGLTGPGHCGQTPAHESTWGGLKSLYR